MKLHQFHGILSEKKKHSTLLPTRSWQKTTCRRFYSSTIYPGHPPQKYIIYIYIHMGSPHKNMIKYGTEKKNKKKTPPKINKTLPSHGFSVTKRSANRLPCSVRNSQRRSRREAWQMVDLNVEETRRRGTKMVVAITFWVCTSSIRGA